MRRERPGERRDTAEVRWPWRLAVAFILVTLLALVVVPWLVQQRVNSLRADIAMSEPARTLVLQWQFDLVQEMAALSELLLTGNTSELGAYEAAWASERMIYERGRRYAAAIGEDVLERFVRARTLSERWHARVAQDEVVRQWQRGTALAQVPRERELFGEVLRSVAQVDSAIIAVTARRRQQIGAAESTGLTLTLVLGVLALLASIAVIALESRVRRFAAEADRRRGLADAALEEAARVTEARTRLLRGVTHDVKNPLGAAQGYAELLSMEVKGPLATEQRPLVEGIERSIDSALAIITDLLDLARAHGDVTVDRVEVDLGDIARQAAADHEASARTAGHTIRTDIRHDTIPAHTDPARVRQILGNLLSNAIKYTPPPGRITVRAAAINGDAPKPGAWATLEVADTGPGIPPDRRESVFEEFTRLDERADAPGHGLGLAVARTLAHRLGGDLTIADSDQGARFVLWIPQRDS